MMAASMRPKGKCLSITPPFILINLPPVIVHIISALVFIERMGVMIS